MVQHPCGPLIIFILLHSNISSEVCHPPPVWFRFCVWVVWAAHLFMFPLSSQSHVHISIKLNPKFPFLFNSHHKFIPIVWSTPIWPRRLCLSSFSRAKVWVPNLGLLVLEPMWCGTCKILSGQIQRPSLYTYWGLLFYSDMYHTPSDKMNQPLAVHFLTDPNCVTPAWNHTFDSFTEEHKLINPWFSCLTHAQPGHYSVCSVDFFIWYPVCLHIYLVFGHFIQASQTSFMSLGHGLCNRLFIPTNTTIM